MALETPVLLCVFNRSALTRRVLGAIARQQPKRLLIVGDGPRPNSPADAEHVAQVRSLIQTVDWPCDVETNFAESNMGCRRRMASGISWAFQRCRRLIILEDDCLPTDEFFPFCEAMLEHYADDQRVMMISGNNFQPHRRTPFSYYFSKYAHIWGWATWQRAWQHYDVTMRQWPMLRRGDLIQQCADDPQEAVYWTDTFDRAYRREIDTWDYGWMLACWQHGGLTILPEVNLIRNLGFGPDATHTTNPDSPMANLPTGSLGTLTHPLRVQRNVAADLFTWRHVFQPAAEEAASLESQSCTGQGSWVRWLSGWPWRRTKRQSAA